MFCLIIVVKAYSNVNYLNAMLHLVRPSKVDKKPIFPHLEAIYKSRLYFRQVCNSVPRRQCAKLTRQECKTVDKPFTTQVMHHIFIERML
jgi:hypothetical protein